MGQSKLELAVDTGKWEGGLKKAQQALNSFTNSQGGFAQALEKDNGKIGQFVQIMGKVNSTAATAKGQMNDYKRTLEQLTTQYNQLTDAQKKTVGQDYLQAIDNIKQKFKQTKEQVEEFNRSLNGVKVPEVGGGGGGLFSGLGDKMSGALQVFAGNMLTKAAGAVASLGSEMVGLVHQGVELAKQGEGIRNAFERLGRGDILNGLREATHGTVTDIELMKAAVKFNDFQLPVEELGTMLAFAQQKAKDTGQSVDYMVDSIVTGLGRKSLMILDNLGLSANEVKEKMKETGDMTKAVGEIIREQMAKAGDYVETAADRAAQANVSLQNKMEELGRKFAPLEEASNSLWTSMKIGILDIVGGPLTDLLNKLTAAGRMANAYGLMGGNAKVGRMTANLAGASEGNRQSIYQQQQEKIWRYINRRENALKDRDRWFKDMGNKELGEHLAREYQAFGTADRGEIQAQIDAAKKMLADYQQAAKQILQPIKQEIEPTITDPKSGKSGKVSTVKPEEILPVGSVAALNKELSELQKQQTMVTNTVEWDSYNDKIKAVTNQIKELKGELGFEALRDVKGVSISGLSKDEATTREDILKKGDKRIKDFKAPTPKDKTEVKLSEEIGKMTSGISSIAGGIESLGVELPQGLKDVLGGIQGVVSILTGISTIISAIEAISAADAVSPFANGGVVRAAGGFSGIVPGTTYSGDQIPAMLNAGEVVLNRAQAGNLASQLEGGMGNLHVTGKLSGHDLLVSIDRTARLEKGAELVFWKR